jgi:uncharacterized protein
MRVDHRSARASNFHSGEHMNIFVAGVVAIGLASVGACPVAKASTSDAPSDESGNAIPSPAFNCARAKSIVEHLFCTTPELAKLDAQLGDLFLNSSGQAGLDAKALRRDEDQWLLKVRGACTDVACLKTAYVERIDALKDQSLQAASPAAYAQTRPFHSDAALWTNAKSFIGRPCSALLTPASAAAAGYAPIRGLLPVVANGASAHAFAKHGTRFAFLFATGKDGSQCSISDVVVLPDPRVADSLLQCNSPLQDASAMTGIGVRLSGQKKVVAYWAINTEKQVFDRIALGVLDAENSMRCQQPETGE